MCRVRLALCVCVFFFNSWIPFTIRGFLKQGVGTTHALVRRGLAGS